MCQLKGLNLDKFGPRTLLSSEPIGVQFAMLPAELTSNRWLLSLSLSLWLSRLLGRSLSLVVVSLLQLDEITVENPVDDAIDHLGSLALIQVVPMAP